MSGEQFSLVWNSFPRNLSSGLYTLLTDEQLVDVTLAAEGQILRAHKLILSVCSTYFRELFKMNSCKHPIVILKDISYRDLSSMLHFMYQGEVNIKQEDISSFLKVAETLQIKGLTAGTDEKFSDTLEGKKDWKDLDFYLDKDEDNPGHTDGHSFRHTVEKEQSTTRQNVSAEGSKEGRPFTEGVGDVSHRQIHTEPGDYNLLPDIQATYSERCASADASSGNVEPLDCTSSDVSQLQSTKHEPLDYTLDTDIDAEYNRTCMVEKVLYNSEENAQRQGPSNVTAFQSDYTSYDASASPSNKGRRTVKGITGSSLPLETTLRVVSELGPTLRFERGKMIRMYSCPWCLRHFTRKENLKLHVRYIHGPLESLTCKLCGNKYKNSNSLRVHSYLYHNAKRDKHGKPLMDGGGGDGGGVGGGDGGVV
ncbi:PREDICTED: protein bric-a-brac 2-like isoform X3 [Dinoponera quadriceps]|uniref:Protein bric-a-brac 2-like isoform X3 n=1 Tax=Dinoponera quadriceps TaxID=609295 RepID=A0A6P3XZW3_DINQU|nr:PREDICTED: protein bric-a-brac 2-like isoform X3 [Dinoponera quadriceps]